MESDDERITRLIDTVDSLMGEDRFDEALAVLADVCELRRQNEGRTVDYAACLTSLALLHSALGEDAAALPLYRESSAVLLEELGEAHPEYLSSLDSLVHTCVRLGDLSTAEELYLRLLTFSASHPGISRGQILSPETIVDVVLDGVRRPATRIPPRSRKAR